MLWFVLIVTVYCGRWLLLAVVLAMLGNSSSSSAQQHRCSSDCYVARRTVSNATMWLAAVRTVEQRKARHKRQARAGLALAGLVVALWVLGRLVA